jgi:hypothetical protein
MRDEDGERDGPPGDSDRLLVRPYIGGPSYQLPESGRPPAADAAPAPATGSPTDGSGAGEAAASPPHAGEAVTAPLPVVPRPAARPDPALDDRDRRQVLWLVGIGITIALAAVAGLILLWPGGGEDPPAADAPVPLAPPSLAPAQEASTPPRSATSPASAATAARTGTPATRPTSAAPDPPTTRPAAPPPATTPPEPTLAAPPAADRAGIVTAPGGRCLDVAGGIVFPGSSLAVGTCNGTLSQRWTLAADGTLRVSGSCATADGADAVEVAACGGAATGQWRAGPGGTLVNLDSGRCLTDSAGGAENGARVGLASCGAAGQRWTLP